MSEHHFFHLISAFQTTFPKWKNIIIILRNNKTPKMIEVRDGHHTLSTKHAHGDVIKWKHFLRHWSFVRGIHRWPVNSPHRGQWRSLVLCAGNSPVTGEFPTQRPVTRSFDVFFDMRVNKQLAPRVDNRGAGDLRRAHYDVIVMNTDEFVQNWRYSNGNSPGVFLRVICH